MNIICRKTGCKYNHNFACTAKEIDVSNKEQCKTFVQQDILPPDTTKNLYKKPPKYRSYRSADTLPIICKAKCQFNHNFHCHANGITVNDLEDCPYCITYFPKIKK